MAVLYTVFEGVSFFIPLVSTDWIVLPKLRVISPSLPISFLNAPATSPARGFFKSLEPLPFAELLLSLRESMLMPSHPREIRESYFKK